MGPATDAGDFDETLGCLTASALERLAAQLASIADLDQDERTLVARTAAANLTRVLHGKLGRLLLLELNAARVNGQLPGDGSDARWRAFIARASTPDFWQSLSRHYPTLLPRVDAILRNRCDSIAEFARSFAADRAALDAFHGSPLGALRGLTMNAGDSHRGGRTVMLVHCRHGRIVYKPRSVAIDVALDRFVRAVLSEGAVRGHVRVPRALDRGEYGWTEFIEHRHVDDASELPGFYRGIGQWLALMRLLGGCDLHAENLIAHGATPTVIDCETLFAPRLKPVPSGMGSAVDLASERISGSVMNTGLLPSRGAGLAWRGVDVSGVGALPGQQPMIAQTRIVGGGSDDARIGTVLVEAPAAQNHPSERPSLDAHWPEILLGFEAMTDTLRRLDAAARLAPLLAPFAACPIRVVPRATEAYAELGRMLWHPVSLHKQDEAERRAHELLAKMAEHKALPPDDDTVIAAEIADLLEGDVPFFTTVAGEGRLQGPRGTSWLEPGDLVAASLRHWRDADWVLEREIIQSTLLSAYENDAWTGTVASLRVPSPATDDLEARRRRQAARTLQLLASTAIRGDDGSVAWIASVLNPTGRSVQPLGQDLYGGISGIALLVAAYRVEQSAGRADAVPGLDDLLPSLVTTMQWAEAQSFQRRNRVRQPRPPAAGGYIGLGSQIWTWLMLDRWEAAQGAGLEHACRLAGLVPEAAAGDEIGDLLSGKAGSLVPLLCLAEAGGRREYLDMAIDLGDQLCRSAHREDGTACWLHERAPAGMGGFAHGASGIGWALSKLARASGLARFEDVAIAAMAFEDRLFDPETGHWRDLRGLGAAQPPAAWCHGAVGIGLALADLDPALQAPRTRTRVAAAADTAWTSGVGLNHGICHGDAGAWEFLDTAIRAGAGPRDLDRDSLLAAFVTSLERHGPVCGLSGKHYAPGLMTGLGGIVYQLLRAHPDSRLPSVMVMGAAR